MFSNVLILRCKDFLQKDGFHGLRRYNKNFKQYYATKISDIKDNFFKELFDLSKLEYD